MAKAEPCPCCKKAPSIVKFEHPYHGPVYQVICLSCTTKPKVVARGYTKQRAIEKWNRRVNNG